MPEVQDEHQMPEAEPERQIPEAAQEAFDAGAREYVEGNTQAAIGYLEQAVAACGEFDQALYVLGLARLRAGSPDLAAEALQKVVQLTPNTMLREFAQRKLTEIGVDVASEP